MVILKLMWWLWNQMFQYAIWKAIATKNKSELFLDLSQLSSWKDSARECELNLFNTKYSIYDKNEIKFSYEPKKFIKFYLNKIFWKLPYKILQERKLINIIWDKLHINTWWYNFHPKFLAIKDNSYLIWFFQSYKYFENIKEELVKDFSPQKSISWKNKELLDSLKWETTCSIHVRRWDYSWWYHGFCSLEYYNKAISTIKNKFENITFLVFSNDIKWCKKNFIGDEFIFVDWNTWKESYRDMILMSKCSHNIIANSSFSWWWGFLNQDKNKVVIAPKKWLNVNFIDTSDLIPNEWICL